MDAAALFVQPPHAQLLGAISSSPQEGVPMSVAAQNYDHPMLSMIMKQLQCVFGEYKYTVYRCAAKFVALQKAFYTSNIPYKLVLAVLERHGVRDAESNLMVPPFQLTSLIHDIYFACEKLGHFTNATAYQLETATAVLANFFWNIFDPHRRHSISLLEIKVTFLVLCKLYSTDQLVAVFYNLVRDPKTTHVSKFSFEYLLNTLTKIFTYIGEGNAYGAHNSQLVMDQCFARCHNTMGLSEYQFHCLWLTTHTRFLIYANLIALIKRIEDTEKLIHNNVCASCHTEKIIGIRFKCQTCRSLSLCLKCFATGYAINKHETGHRMYEVFTEDLPPKKFTHYFAKLCNLFFSAKSSEEATGFCNSNEMVAYNDTELVTIGTNDSAHTSNVNAAVAASPQQIHKLNPSTAGLSTTTSNASNVSERLQTIIDRLLQQNVKLEYQLKCVKTSTHDEIFEFLSTHQRFLIEIINEMRNFSQASCSLSSFPTSSTPNRSIVMQKDKPLDSFTSGGTQLTHSINGADINRSYLDANKSDYSINDLSLWFNQRRLSALPTRALSVLTEVANDGAGSAIRYGAIAAEMRETEMSNFKLLLNKVREIVDDSYSDNTELAAATQNLENVLDNIIQNEETRRKSM